MAKLMMKIHISCTSESFFYETWISEVKLTLNIQNKDLDNPEAEVQSDAGIESDEIDSTERPEVLTDGKRMRVQLSVSPRFQSLGSRNQI